MIYDGEAHDLVCRVLDWLTVDNEPQRAIELLQAARKDHERRYALTKEAQHD